MPTGIRTRYFEAVKGEEASIRAQLINANRSVTILYPDELELEEAHQAALAALCIKLHLPIEIEGDEWIALPTFQGYIFVRNS